MTRTRLLLVPVACVAIGALTLCFQGCSKESSSEKAGAPALNSPEVYMNDPVFRKQLSDKRLELQSLAATRAKLVKRMEELVKSNGADRAVLEKIPEWRELYKKVVDLNTKYDEVRQKQLAIFAKRAASADAGAKGAASNDNKKISK